MRADVPLDRRAGDAHWAVSKLVGRGAATGRLRSSTRNLLPATVNHDRPAPRNSTESRILPTGGFQKRLQSRLPGYKARLLRAALRGSPERVAVIVGPEGRSVLRSAGRFLFIIGSISWFRLQKASGNERPKGTRRCSRFRWH